MSRHHRDHHLLAFPRSYPVRRDQRLAKPVEPEHLQPLLSLVLLLQGLTLLLLVAGPFPVRLHPPGLPSTSQPGLAGLPDNQANPSPLFRALMP